MRRDIARLRMTRLGRHMVDLLLLLRNHGARTTDTTMTNNASPLLTHTHPATILLLLRRARRPIRTPSTIGTRRRLETTITIRSHPLLLWRTIVDLLRLRVQNIVVNHLHHRPAHRRIRTPPPCPLIMIIGVMGHHPATDPSLVLHLYLNQLPAIGIAPQSGDIVRVLTDTSASHTLTTATTLAPAPHRRRDHPNPTIETLSPPILGPPTGRLPCI